MKIYISADIEGVCGIQSWDETSKNNPSYAYFQKEMTKEVISCCKALHESGVEEIYVRDAHDYARNLLLDELPIYVKVIRGWEESPCDMMAGLDETFDGAIFIGYHSPSRSAGNPLSHTLNTSINHIKINDKIVSEFLLNAYYAKLKKVPVILVTGDVSLTNDVKKENDNIATVPTNEGMHGAIIAKHSDIIQNEIYEKTKETIKKLKTAKKDDLFVMIPKSIETEVHFRTHQKAYRASFYPNTYLRNFDKVVHQTTNFNETLTFLMFVL